MSEFRILNSFHDTKLVFCDVNRACYILFTKAKSKLHTWKFEFEAVLERFNDSILIFVMNEFSFPSNDKFMHIVFTI